MISLLRLYPRNRGYEHLIEAVREMKDTILLVAGTVLEKDVYRQLLLWEEQMPNLKVAGKWIPNEEVQWYFNACDIVRASLY